MCDHMTRVPKTIQICRFPDSLYRKLKSRAALEGLSLPDYILRKMKHIVERPALDDLEECLSGVQPVKPGISVQQIIREERDRR